MKQIKTIKIKDRVRRAIYALAAAGMVVMAAAPQTYAEDMHDYIPPAGDIGSVQDVMRDQALGQLVSKIALQCVSGGVNRNESWSNVIKPDKWFDRTWDDLTIDTGYWYEKKIQGKFDDGRINCSDTGGMGPIQTFAQLMGVSDNAVFCNGTSAGVAKNKDGYDCGSSDGNYTRNGNNGGDGATRIDWSAMKNQGYYSHLKSIYDNHKAEKKWENTVEIGNSGTFDGIVGYWLYRNEIEIKCGGSTEQDSASGDLVLKDVTQTAGQAGKIVYRKFGQNSTFAHEFVDNSYVGSCSSMIARANSDEIYLLYQDRLIATLNAKCKEDIDRRKQLVEDAGGTLNEETMAAYNAALADTTNYNIGQFISGDASSGWVCADIGDFQGATQDDPTPPDEEYGDEESTEPDCYTNAGSLGWILCPIINQAADAIQGLYENMVVPFLVLEPGLFNIDGPQNGTYVAWSQFRDIANLGFILLFLFVIFSQLTGVGIDNYGIKKILPKLIMGALMINLSFFICQAAIDIANVVGYGIQGVFENLATVPPDLALTENPGVKTPTSAVVILIAIIIVICAGAYLAIGPSALIPVFMTVLSVLIAIVFVFITLSVRKAFAVLLVVASPLAFMCYMLPNLKKTVFDKWYTAFKAMIIAFPVCSAMIYGGQMVARILIMAAGGAKVPSIIAMSAAVVSIVPIFMIPKAIQGSMGAISGGIAKLSTRTRFGVGRRARGALERSGLNNYRNYRAGMAAQRRQARQNEYSAKRGQRLIDKYNKHAGPGGANPATMSAADRRNYNAAFSAVNARDREVEESYASYYSGKSDADIMKDVMENANGGEPDQNMIIAGLSQISDENNLFDAYQKLNSTEAGQALFKDTNFSNRAADVFTGRNGSVINQSIGKLLKKGSSYDDIMGGELAAKVQGAGTGIMANQDKDVFKTEGAAALFSNEQIAAGIGAGYSGSTADAFNSMVSGMDQGRKDAIAGVMTAEQVAGLKQGSLQAMGGAGTITNNNQSAIDTLNSADGQNLRTSMDGAVMNSLGISSVTPAGDGGGAEAAPTSPAMMSDDDLAYANKMKEMSQRGADYKGPEPTGRGTNSKTGKERAAEGNWFDYYPKQPGETNEAYKARIDHMKELTKQANGGK